MSKKVIQGILLGFIVIAFIALVIITVISEINRPTYVGYVVDTVDDGLVVQVTVPVTPE